MKMKNWSVSEGGPTHAKAQHSEETFRTLVEYGSEGLLILNEEGIATYVSSAVRTILGYEPEELLDTNLILLAHPDDLPAVSATFAEVLEKPNVPVKVHICRIRHKDGSYRWLESVATNMLHNPAVNGIVDSFRDVTQDRIAEEKLLYANRLYNFLSHINQTIVHVTDEQTLFDEACRIAVDHGRFRYAWIGIPATETRKINVAASAGTTRRDREFFADYHYDENGPISKVLAGVNYHVVDHIQSHNNLKFNAYANDRGFQSAIVLAIKKSGRTFAVLNLYAEERNFFHAREIALLVEASGDLSFALDVFERDRQRTLAEHALRQKEVRLSRAQAIARIGSWDLNFATGILNWSDEALRIYGLSPEHRKQTFEDWINQVHPDDRDCFAAQLNNSRTDWSDSSIYHRIVRKDGSIAHVHSMSHFEFDENGTAYGMTGVVHDLTEKKGLEVLLDKATKMARIGGYEMDMRTNVMFWSPITRYIHEVADDFVPDLANSVGFYKEGEHRDALIEAAWNALKNGTSWDLELQITTAKGNERWVRVIGETEHLNGRCLRVYGSFQDIDSRKRAELEVLNIAEEKNRVLESIGDAFFAVDKEWNITYWNKEAEQFLGRKREEMIGKNLWDEYPDAIDSPYYTNYHAAVRDNTSRHFDALYEARNMWTEVSAYPSPSGLSVYFKDVTQRKLAEEERAAMMTEIIQRNKGLEQFSYIVSHNLRGPVANILGIARELEHDNNTPEMEQMFREGLAISAQRLDSVITDLNNILQLKKDAFEKVEMVSFTELVDSIRESVIDQAHAGEVTMNIDFSQADEISSVKSYLHSIFYNLIVNSIKYRQAEVPPVISIRTEKNNGMLTVHFSDNGLGIDLERRGDQVFGLYKRFHHHVDGKGLGLFMVKTQVEMLDGKISISSIPNVGTQFKIDFQLQ